MSWFGVVVIGRNEGARLERCLKSVVGQSAKVIYVDSGSTDRSVATAKAFGAEVIELPQNKKFTAARARNAGWAAMPPEIEFVQFIDGDCEVDPQWLLRAAAELESTPDLAVVCGRHRERFPDASVYNTLCDLEWNTPVGPAKACGGDSMIRLTALSTADGFNANLIAGEEPELCVRLRAVGWKVVRLDAEMTLHDADLHRFSQWWRRNVRNGHAFAEGSAMHGSGPDKHWVKETRSNWVWGLFVPLLALIAAWPTYGISLFLFGLYPIQAFRIFRYGRSRGWPVRSSFVYAVFCTLGKFPQMLGQLTYRRRAMLGTESQLIEYKTIATPALQIEGMDRP